MWLVSYTGIYTLLLCGLTVHILSIYCVVFSLLILQIRVSLSITLSRLDRLTDLSEIRYRHRLRPREGHNFLLLR